MREVPAATWTDSELFRALDAPASSLPGKLVAVFAEARRRGFEPGVGSSLVAVWRGFVDRPGSALLLGVGSAAILVGWPLLWAVALRGQLARWVVGGWGATALFALALPALLALALALVRRRAPDLGQLRGALVHAPVSVAALAVAFTWAVPAVLLGAVPCLGGLLVFAAWLGLLIRAAGATCFALERGLDPLGALAAHRHAERRWGRAPRYGLAGALTSVGLVVFSSVFALTVGLGESGAAPILSIAVGALGVGLATLVSAGAFLLGAAAHGAALSGQTEPREPDARVRTYGPQAPEPGPLPWLATLALLVPLGTPFWGAALVPLVRSSTLPTAAWVAIPTAHLISLLGGLLLLHIHRARVRVVAVDWTGVTLDPQGGWPGRYLPWSRVRGFALEEDGVRLVIEGERLSRWLGPIVPAREREVHDLVEMLEKRGVERL